ncbi:MAG: hypothetical protein WC726_04140 [Parcubacteria group bacterium]
MVSLEDDIGQFGDGERRYVRKWVDIYPNELQQAIHNREEKGERITDKAVAAIRLSLINNIARWGRDRRGIAPEKANLIEKYLELKLPHGVPPETAEELHIGEREAIKKTEKERAKYKTEIFMKEAADARQTKIEETLPGRGTQVDESLKDLNTKNKHMEIKDIGKQLKQDREELRKAKMLPEESFPVGAGFMGAPVDLDAREAEEVKARRTGTEDKKEKEPEFSPEEVEEIKKIAHYISERRMAGDNEGARAWQKELAKEYGLDENAFSKETIEKLLSDNGLGDKRWTPEAQKFMQDWDSGKAEEAFRNMKKIQEQEEKENVDTPGKTEEPFYPPVVVSGSERERSVVPVKPEVYTAKPIPIEPQQKALEGPSEKTIEELRADLDASAEEYAAARGNARGSRGYLAKLLGMSKKGFSENVENMEEVKNARLKYLQSKDAHQKAWKESAFKEYQELLESKKGTISEEELSQMKESLAAKLDVMAKYHNTIEDLNLQDGFIKKTVEYYKTKGGVLGKVFGKYLDFYNDVYLKKVPPKVRAAISIVMLGGTVAGLAGAVGFSGVFVGAAALVAKPARFLLAPLFPAMTYAGTGKMIEKGQKWFRAKKTEKQTATAGGIIEKMKSGEVSVEDTMKNLTELLEEQSGEYGEELVKRGWAEDRCEQVRNLLTMFVGTRATMVLMSGTEAIGSFFEGKGNAAGSAQTWAKTTHAAGATQEVAPSRASIPVDDVKPKAASVAPESATRPRAGAAVEQQPTRARGGGKMKFPPEVEALDRKAAASGARALESQRNADSLKAQSAGLDAVNSAANTRIFLGMRPRFYEIFQGAGFSNHANIGGSSALECYNQIMDKDYIADDVILADKVKVLNDNTVKLIKMFLKFGKPSGGMSMDDYWRIITSKSRNLQSLNDIISKK